MKNEKNTGKVDSVDDLFNDLLKDAEYGGVPALSYLEQGLCIDDATNAMEKPDLLRLLSKAVLLVVILDKEKARLQGQVANTQQLAITAGSVALQKKEAFGKIARHQLAKKGGKGRGEKYKPLKELAAQLVNAGKFKSRRNAAKTIAPEIIAKSKELGFLLSKDQAETTITGWLKEMGLPVNI